MAENNQTNYNQQNEDWEQSRNRHNRENEYNQSGAWGNKSGTNYEDENRGMRRGYGVGGNQYGNSSYGQNSNQNRREDERYRNTGNSWGSSGFSGSQYGDSAGSDYGQSGSEVYGSQGRTGSPYDSRNTYGNASFGNQQQRDDDWNRQDNQWNQQNQSRQNWNRGNANYGSSYGGRQNYEQNYRPGNQYRNTGNWGDAYDQNRGEDRSWWERTKDQVSSWFSDDDNNRGERESQRRSGGHKGKGPKEYQRSTERIREDVYDRLSDDDHIDATNISVQVNNNEVVLSGTVNSREEKRHAEDLVESVSGVRHVENRIRVGGSDDNSRYSNAGNTASRTSDGLSSRDYTGNTDMAGGIGSESGTTNEIIRNADKDKNK